MEANIHHFVNCLAIIDYLIFEDEAKMYVVHSNATTRTLILYDVSNRNYQVRLGSWSLSQNPENIVANSNRTLLFIGRGFQGCSILNISNRTAVTTALNSAQSTLFFPPIIIIIFSCNSVLSTHHCEQYIHWILHALNKSI